MTEHNSRQRLRPWLMGQLDNQSIPGLIWLPNENGEIDRKKFRIPWKHGGKHDWTPDQSRVFKEWAIHTGKYREGVDDETFARWKTNLRCALNKASDIQEITEESQREADHPFKVYKFLPRKNKTVSHPPRTNYAPETSNFLQTIGEPGLPPHVASYSSPSSSLSISATMSGLSGGTPMNQDKFIRSNSFGIPPDLEDLKSDSLRDATQGLTALDTKSYFKGEEEDMDFENDDEDSSDLKQLHYQPQTIMGVPVIKQERTEHPGLSCANSEADGPSKQHDPQSTLPVQMLHVGETDFLNDETQRHSPCYFPNSNLQAITRPSDLSLPDFINAKPSSSFSAAASPHLSYCLASPNDYSSPSSNRHFVSTTETCGQLEQYSTATSPTSTYVASPEAPISPQEPFTPQPLSPQENKYTGTAPHASQSNAQNQHLKPEYGSEFVNQMAELGVSDIPYGATSTIQYPQQIQYDTHIDIGHQCPQASDEYAMLVRILYKNKEISCHHVTEEAGCIIAYKPITQQQGQLLDEVGLNVVKEKVYDQKPGRREIALPEWGKSQNPKLDYEVDNLLKNAGRGIVVECKNGDIYAKRLCKTSVYFASHFNNEKYEKLCRQEDVQEKVKIFDFHNNFQPAIYHLEQETRRSGKNEVLKHPNPDAYLFIGQNGKPSNAHTRYVVIKITSCKASKVLKTMERTLFSLSAEVSKSDNLDKIHNVLQQEFEGHAL